MDDKTKIFSEHKVETDSGTITYADLVVDFGNGQRAIVEIKASPDCRPELERNLVEKTKNFLYDTCFVGRIYKNKCLFEYFDKTNTVNYYKDNEIKTCTISGEYQSIVCEIVFGEPLKSHSGYDIFDAFKESRAKKGAEVFQEEYARQVRSAVEGVNKKLKEAFDLDDDVLFYDETPKVTVNEKYLVRE